MDKTKRIEVGIGLVGQCFLIIIVKIAFFSLSRRGSNIPAGWMRSRPPPRRPVWGIVLIFILPHNQCDPSVRLDRRKTR